jgi:N-acetyl sugar amidotransferase
MSTIRYCVHCLYPETKPDLFFDARGVCSACQSFEARGQVDWSVRRSEFDRVVAQYKSSDGSNYDCLVPVSGGKDSTYQVLRLIEAGLNPLCVTATTDSLSDVGRHNIENIKKLGVDYIEVSANPVIRRRLNKLALLEVGDISWPEHVTIFTVPVRVAVNYGIRLIVWGENPQNEYGGPAAASKNNTLDRRWLEEFGGLLGLRVSDLLEIDGIKPHHLIQYTYPSNEVLQRAQLTAIFLGYYFPWDGYANALYAQAFGFRTLDRMVEGSLANYENLDNYQTGIHDYFKYLKYGFGRATDIANNHIRRGRMSREDAWRMVERHDGMFPWTYLGRPIKDILGEVDVTVDDFIQICDKYTNRRLFHCDNRGNLVKDADGNLRRLFSPLE